MTCPKYTISAGHESFGPKRTLASVAIKDLMKE